MCNICSQWPDLKGKVCVHAKVLKPRHMFASVQSQEFVASVCLVSFSLSDYFDVNEIFCCACV